LWAWMVLVYSHQHAGRGNLVVKEPFELREWMMCIYWHQHVGRGNLVLKEPCNCGHGWCIFTCISNRVETQVGFIKSRFAAEDMLI
jgi:hypothetical protein